jgi:hypothetical protein
MQASAALLNFVSMESSNIVVKMLSDIEISSFPGLSDNNFQCVGLKKEVAK